MRLGRLRDMFGGGAPPRPTQPRPPATLASLASEYAAEFATAGTAAPPPPAARFTHAAHGTGAWSAVRLDVIEELWGDGFFSPDGADEVLRLAGPLRLSGSASVLLLGAGTGGAARVLAEAFDARVHGYEADPALAAIAAARLERVGGEVARLATVLPWTPAAPSFALAASDHAIALDIIHGDAAQPALTAAALALKPGGQFAIVQIASDTRVDPRDPGLTAWAALEQRSPVVPVVADITRILLDLGFEIGNVEDVSAGHCRRVLKGWARLVRTLDGPKPAPLHAAAILQEAERWMRRLRLMQAGQIRLVQWHGVAREAAGASS